jgi:hypothetical protein
MFSAPDWVNVVTRETVPPRWSPATTDEPAMSLTKVQPVDTDAPIPQSANQRDGRIGFPYLRLLTPASLKNLDLPTPWLGRAMARRVGRFRHLSRIWRSSTVRYWRLHRGGLPQLERRADHRHDRSGC